jgi:hypothetical protein
MTTELYLINEQFAAPFQEFPELLGELAQEHNLDGYTSRQQLLGQAQALLAKGSAERLLPLQNLLAEYEIASYLFTPSPIKFAPFTLISLETAASELRLYGREKQVILPKGARLLILLSDLSGNLSEGSLRQITSVQRYQGVGGQRGLSSQRQQHFILQGRPVLDIYLLDEEGTPSSAVRAFPGKFDIKGLGERATLSTVQNLLKLCELAQEYAGECRIDMNFGLSPIPGANLHSGSAANLEGIKKNLQNLTRYAWLQTDIDRQRAQLSKAPANEVAMLTAAAMTAMQPELATLPPHTVQPLAKVLDSDQEVAPEQNRRQRTPVINPTLLPPPQAIQRHSLWTSPKALAGYFGLGLVPLLIYLIEKQWLSLWLKTGFSSGIISGALAIGLYVWAFHRLKLKRLIENTPTSKIRSVAMGMVEIKGTARRQYALISPMANLACVYYRLTRYNRDKNNNLVVSSISSSGQVPFWVEDETGRISVMPEGASVIPENKLESMDEAGAALSGFYPSDEKWVEEIIYDGALVYVLGEAQVKRSDAQPRSARRGKALRQLKQDRNRLAGYDTNADGRVDSEEWQAACAEVDEQLLREDLAASDERRRQEDHVVIARPSQRGAPFVIAEAPAESSVTRDYALSMNLIFGVASSAALLTAWLMIRQFQPTGF